MFAPVDPRLGESYYLAGQYLINNFNFHSYLTLIYNNLFLVLILLLFVHLFLKTLEKRFKKNGHPTALGDTLYGRNRCVRFNTGTRYHHQD